MGRLDTMLLWGHSLADYRQMFALTDDDLQKNILDYGAGPASFNAEMHALGHSVLSADEIYTESEQDLAKRFEKEFGQMLSTVQADPERFVWDSIKTPEQLEQLRREATCLFLQDYAQGREQGRYVSNSYPQLSFSEHQFALAVASHAVFITNAHQPPEYLVDLLHQLAQAAQEVRVFPLLDGQGNISPLVGPVLLGLQQYGYGTEVREVSYEFQRGGNAMLRLWIDHCDV